MYFQPFELERDLVTVPDSRMPSAHFFERSPDACVAIPARDGHSQARGNSPGSRVFAAIVSDLQPWRPYGMRV